MDVSIGIIVKTINNDLYNFTVPTDLPVPELKRRVKESTSVNEDRQRLIYRGHVLQDSNVISDYKIEDGHTIHMVARPENYRELQAVANTPPQPARLPSLREALQTPIGGPLTPPREPRAEDTSLEAIRQGLLTMTTLLSTTTLAPLPDRYESRFHRRSNKRFYIGQWIDVKDTVNQWLEATIMNINSMEQKVFVHYNGWPTRWDEWIHFDSPRISPFRTRTSNALSSPTQACPCPVTNVPAAPLTGRDDVRHVMPEIYNMFRLLVPALDEISSLSQQSVNLHPESHDHTQANGQSISTSSELPWHRMRPMTPPPDNADDSRLYHLTREVVPLLDRFSRVLTDVTPHLHTFLRNEESRLGLQHTAPPPPHEVDPLLTLPFTRLRSASPPPENHYRLPVTPVVRPILPESGGNHLDIHIHAILTPLRAPERPTIPTQTRMRDSRHDETSSVASSQSSSAQSNVTVRSGSRVDRRMLFSMLPSLLESRQQSNTSSVENNAPSIVSTASSESGTARRDTIRQYQLFREDMRELSSEARSSRRQRIMTEEEGSDYFAPETAPSERLSETAEDFEDEMISVGDGDSIRMLSEEDTNSQRHSLEYVSSESADEVPVRAPPDTTRTVAQQREEARSFIDRVRRSFSFNRHFGSSERDT